MEKKDNIDLVLEEVDELTDDLSDFKWYDTPVLIVFWALIIIVSLQFITRYILNDSLSWTEEIARYFLILLGFIGGITCVRKGKHIFLEFFYRYLPISYIKPIAIFVESVVSVFFAYIGYLSIELATRSSQNMVSINLPKSVLYYSVMIACFLMAIFALLNVIRYLKLNSQEVYKDKLGVIS